MRLLLLLWLAPFVFADGLKRQQSMRPDFAVAQWRVLDGGILLIGTNGEVRTWRFGARGRLERVPRGTLRLKDGQHTLVALGDLSGKGGRPQLLVMDSNGTRAYSMQDDGTFGGEPVVLARRARLRLRTNQPLFAEVLQDVNGDGRPDLIVPGDRQSELWIAKVDGFRRAAVVSVDTDRVDNRKVAALSDRLTAAFRIPRLKFDDVNGDGRSDLVVSTGRRRAFHLQRADGTIPAEPDIEVDLNIFRDTTPKAAVRAGKTLAGSDKARYQSRDLDADGIPDYVIAHRRKVWVFHGSKDGPQFVDPTSILKVSDDVTAMMITHLDDDKYPDLLILRVHVPSVAGLLLGVLRSLEIELFARGYRSKEGRTFERTPAWRSEITLRVPSIVSILKNPGRLLVRFEDVGRKFRHQRSGDLDGDGADETLLLSADRTRLDVWRGKRSAAKANSVELESEMRRLLFSDKNRKWDLDRLLSFFGGLAERRTANLTGGRDPDATYALRDADRFEFKEYALLDLPGKAGKAIVIRYLPVMSGARPIFDVVRFKPS